MTERLPFPADSLTAAGLNRHFVFDLADLPDTVRATLGDTDGCRQLILLGHGGRRLWDCLQTSGLGGEHPIDAHCVRTVRRWLAEQLPGRTSRIVYPGEQPVGLQALGRLAGWHHDSPFRVGIDAEWGSWFAYRAVILADCDFLPSFPVDRGNPCPTCVPRLCVTTCPAGALEGGAFSLERCAAYRLQSGSPCAEGCLARKACPVGAEHRYTEAQIRHSYSRSLAMLRSLKIDQ